MIQHLNLDMNNRRSEEREKVWVQCKDWCDTLAKSNIRNLRQHFEETIDFFFEAVRQNEYLDLCLELARLGELELRDTGLLSNEILESLSTVEEPIQNHRLRQKRCCWSVSPETEKDESNPNDYTKELERIFSRAPADFKERFSNFAKENDQELYNSMFWPLVRDVSERYWWFEHFHMLYRVSLTAGTALMFFSDGEYFKLAVYAQTIASTPALFNFFIPDFEPFIVRAINLLIICNQWQIWLAILALFLQDIEAFHDVEWWGIVLLCTNIGVIVVTLTCLIGEILHARVPKMKRRYYWEYLSPETERCHKPCLKEAICFAEGQRNSLQLYMQHFGRDSKKIYLKNKFRTMRYLIETHYMPDELKKLALRPVNENINETPATSATSPIQKFLLKKWEDFSKIIQETTTEKLDELDDAYEEFLLKLFGEQHLAYLKSDNPTCNGYQEFIDILIESISDNTCTETETRPAFQIFLHKQWDAIPTFPMDSSSEHCDNINIIYSRFVSDLFGYNEDPGNPTMATEDLEPPAIIPDSLRKSIMLDAPPSLISFLDKLEPSGVFDEEKQNSK